MLTHSPYCRGHFSQAKHSSPNGTSLRGDSSPTGITLPHSVVLKPAMRRTGRRISLFKPKKSLQAEAYFWELRDFSWTSSGTGVDKSHPWCTAWFLLHTPRPSKESQKLWNTDSSKQIAQGQSLVVSDMVCTRICAALPNTSKETQRASKHGKTKKQTPNDRTREFSRKRTIWNVGKQFIRYKV